MEPMLTMAPPCPWASICRNSARIGTRAGDVARKHRVPIVVRRLVDGGREQRLLVGEVGRGGSVGAVHHAGGVQARSSFPNRCTHSATMLSASAVLRHVRHEGNRRSAGAGDLLDRLGQFQRLAIDAHITTAPSRAARMAVQAAEAAGGGPGDEQHFVFQAVRGERSRIDRRNGGHGILLAVHLIGTNRVISYFSGRGVRVPPFCRARNSLSVAMWAARASCTCPPQATPSFMAMSLLF